MNDNKVHARIFSSKIFARRKILFVFFTCILILGLALTVVVRQPAHADNNSFTQGATTVNTSQAQFWFRPSGWSAGYVILHYLQSSNNQQNVNMSYNSGSARWEYTAGGMSSGQSIPYSFTYQENGLQYDTSNYTFTFGSSSGSTPTPTAVSGSTPTPITAPTNGSYPLVLQNNTQGTWSNSQIYVLILGQATPGQWSYVKADGTVTHINHLDASAPNHLTKNGVNYANMSFSLAQASTIPMPTSLVGARMYISLGSPMYIPIAPDDSGWGGPDLNNPNDPNADVYFDWYEFAYQYGVTPFGGNTTQVDMFGFPLTARVQQTSSGFDQTAGITLSRSQVYSQYAAAVGSVFQPLATTYRILSPRSSSIFGAGGSQQNYWQSYIDQTWSYYTTNQFTFTSGGSAYSGKVVNGQLQFTVNRAGSYVLNKPTSSDVFACSGALASGGMTTQELALGAQFCAAFNRGIAMNTASWNTVSAYYTNSVYNNYAKFWHQCSINNKAYGFPYDDVNNQSSVAILPNANPPSSLTIGIGW